MNKLLNVLLFLTQVTLILTQLTDSHKCKITDSSCLKKTAQDLIPYFTAGIPEIHVDSLDPMHINAIKFELSGLKLAIKDATVKGLKNAVIEKIKFDMNKKNLEVTYHADVGMKGKYKASGRLLVLPIAGDGDADLSLETVQVDMIMPFEIKKNENGKDVIHLKSYKYKFDIKKKAHFDLTNLFNGNKETSDILLRFMNENWKQLAQEFGKPMLEKPMKKSYEAIKNYFMSKPLDDLVLNV